METQKLIDKLTKAMTYAFRSDGTSPGLTVSWIYRTKMYYVSIVRWVNGEKLVVCSDSNVDLNEALSKVALSFLTQTPSPTNPIDDLSELITSDTLLGSLVSDGDNLDLQKLDSLSN